MLILMISVWRQCFTSPKLCRPRRCWSWRRSRFVSARSSSPSTSRISSYPPRPAWVWSPRISPQIFSKYYFGLWMVILWCGKSSLFPEVLESLVDVAQLLANHVVGVDQTFLSWNLEEFSCFLSDITINYLIIYVIQLTIPTPMRHFVCSKS